MIAQLAAETRTLVADCRVLQKGASQAKTVEETLVDIAGMRQSVEAWATAYTATKTYLTAEQRNTIRDRTRRILHRIEESRAAFEVDYAQHAPLNSARSMVDKLSEEARAYWAQYAETRLQSLRDYARLAHQIPELKEQIRQIDDLSRNLRETAQVLPQNASAVSGFHNRLAALHGLLQTVKNLEPEQAEFLDKVRCGTATLDDVTDSLLQWCKQKKMAGSIRLGL